METIIFKVYEVIKFNKEYKGGSEFNSIDTLLYNGKLIKNNTYVCIGEINADNSFKAKEVYFYENVIGKITNLKALSKDTKELEIESDNKKIQGITSFFKTEKNTLSVFKGFYKKNIFNVLFICPIQKIKVRIISEPKRCVFNYALKECKVQLCDDYLNSIKLDKFKIRGVLELIYQNDEITIEGYFQENKYGECFYVLKHFKDISSGEKLIKAYLKKQLGSGNDRLSPKSIDKMVNYFKLDTLNILENNPQRIKEVFPKIKDDKIEKIKDRIIMSQFIQELYFFCEKENIDARIADKIYKEYGLSSIKVLKDNPYKLVEIDESLFPQADILAKANEFLYNDEVRLKASINYFIKNDSKENGNVYTNINEIYENLNNFLNISGAYDSKSVIDKDDIDAIIDSECASGNLVKDKDRIYLKYNYAYEIFIAKKVKELLTDFKNPFTDEQHLDIAIDEFNKKISLTKKQKSAIKKALLSNISILTGGPGTGKTLTVRAIISCIKNINSYAKFKLAAPTGRASQRLAEVTNQEATTIHKLLNIGMYQSSLEIEESSALEDLDFLIIDEFSMVDIELFYKILKCIDDKTRLIIIGDYNQLPSVSPGQILKDLIDSKKIPTTRLTEIFRQDEGSLIVEVSSAINENKDIDFKKLICNKENFLKQDFSFIEAKTLNKIEEITMYIVENLLKDNSFRDFQILCPTNKGDTGTIKLNEEMQKNFNKTDKLQYVNNISVFKENDKVIHIINDYELGVMNGSIGFIKSIIPTENENFCLTVEYEDKEASYELKNIEEIKLAYAITIHKSQGSEFPITIIPIHKSQLNILNLNLLYTAITRARNNIIVIGDKEAFIDALKIKATNRNSGLIERL